MPAIFSLLSTHFQYCLVFVFGALLFESLVSVRFTHLKHLFFVLEDLFSYIHLFHFFVLKIFFEVYIVFLGYMLYLVLELHKQLLKLFEFCSY